MDVCVCLSQGVVIYRVDDGDGDDAWLERIEATTMRAACDMSTSVYTQIYTTIWQQRVCVCVYT